MSPPNQTTEVPLHICILLNEYPPYKHGGLGSKYQIYCRDLVKHGWRVTVVGVYAEVEKPLHEVDRGVQVHRLPSNRIRGWASLINSLRIQKQIRRLSQEAKIHVLEGPELCFGFIPKSFPCIKVIRMGGGHHFFSILLGKRPRRLRAWLEKRSFRNADIIAGVSRFVIDRTMNLLEMRPPKTYLLPNPVDTDTFKPSPAITKIPGLLIFFGYLVEKKGIRQLIRAMPAIVARHPQVHLEVYGRDINKDGSYLRQLRKEISASMVERIHFMGFLEHELLPETLARAEICVLPSHMEAHPNAWLEVLAMGKPLVAGDIGPAAEVLMDGESGLLCDPRDPRDIAAKINRLLDDDLLREEMGRQARLRAENLFSHRVILAKNRAFYREICGPNP